MMDLFVNISVINTFELGLLGRQNCFAVISTEYNLMYCSYDKYNWKIKIDKDTKW